MESKQVEGGFILKLTRGEELLESLQKFCLGKGVKSGWLSGLGSTDHVKLSYFDPEKKEYQTRDFSGPLEIVNLTGNIAQKDGATVLHAHATLGQTDYSSVAGHIDHLKVGATLEIFLVTFSSELIRKKDDQIGLNLFDFS